MSGPPERRPVLTDDAVRAMLEARVERAGQIRFDASLVAFDAVRRARAQPRPPSLLPRLALAASSVAALLVLALVVALPLASRPASAPPTTGPSASARPSPVASSVALPRLLTPAELGELVRTRARELDRTIVAVRGRLERDPSMPCVAGETCANTLLGDSGGGFHLRPVGDIGPGPWDGSGPKDGTFAVRITAGLEGGRPVVDFIGDLVNRDDGTFVLSVADIVRGAVQMEGAFAAVDGWLVRTSLHPCPSNPRPPPGPAYGCPDDDWLTESEFQPLRQNGVSIEPPDAIYLPAGSYDEWAPDPAHFGADGLGVEPRRATWLMRLVRDSCAPNADCFGSETFRWRIVGRFDPIPGFTASPAQSPEPSPTPSAASNTSPTRTVAELASLTKPPGPGDYIVRGFLVSTPPLKCVYARGPYGCGEYDWLTDEPFQAWTADGTTSSARQPTVGLRVQTGAYDRFAPSPAVGKFGAREPQLGTYLVRLTMHSACEFVLQPLSSPPCTGPNILLWEVIARLP